MNRKVSLDSPEDLKVYPPPPVATGPGLDRPLQGPGHLPAHDRSLQGPGHLSGLDRPHQGLPHQVPT